MGKSAIIRVDSGRQNIPGPAQPDPVRQQGAEWGYVIPGTATWIGPFSCESVARAMFAAAWSASERCQEVLKDGLEAVKGAAATNEALAT